MVRLQIVAFISLLMSLNSFAADRVITICESKDQNFSFVMTEPPEETPYLQFDYKAGVYINESLIDQKEIDTLEDLKKASVSLNSEDYYIALLKFDVLGRRLIVELVHDKQMNKTMLKMDYWHHSKGTIIKEIECQKLEYVDSVITRFRKRR